LKYLIVVTIVKWACKNCKPDICFLIAAGFKKAAALNPRGFLAKIGKFIYSSAAVNWIDLLSA